MIPKPRGRNQSSREQGCSNGEAATDSDGGVRASEGAVRRAGNPVTVSASGRAVGEGIVVAVPRRSAVRFFGATGASEALSRPTATAMEGGVIFKSDLRVRRASLVLPISWWRAARRVHAMVGRCSSPFRLLGTIPSPAASHKLSCCAQIGAPLSSPSG